MTEIQSDITQSHTLSRVNTSESSVGDTHATSAVLSHLERASDGRTMFAHRVDEADDALGLEATAEEKLKLGHWIVGAWEDTLACRDCNKSDDDVLACGKRTLIRENGTIRFAVMRCDRYRLVCRRRRLERLFGQSRLGTRFSDRTFDTFETDESNRRAYEMCRKLADTFPQTTRGLLLAGGCGSGKTHLAAATVHALIARGYHAVFVTVGRYLDSLKNAFGDADKTRTLQDEVRRCDLLALDDLGTEHISDWARSELFSLLNDRYEQMLPTLLTTNLTMEELTARLGQRSVSRIAEMTDGVRLHSLDRRLLRHMRK